MPSVVLLHNFRDHAHGWTGASHDADGLHGSAASGSTSVQLRLPARTRGLKLTRMHLEYRCRDAVRIRVNRRNAATLPASHPGWADAYPALDTRIPRNRRITVSLEAPTPLDVRNLYVLRDPHADGEYNPHLPDGHPGKEAAA